MSEKIYTPEEKKVLLEKAFAFAKQVGSANKAGAILKVSGAILSGLKSGTYKGDQNKWYAILEDYFEAEDASSTVYKQDEYIATSISEDVYEIIRNCQLKGGLAIACGDAGIGKTQAAKKYLKDNSNLTTYIALNPCITTIKPILKLLCNKLSINEKTIDEMWMAIASKLSNKMVLIFDEAQHLPIKTIESLRAFSDYFAEQGQTLGIVFIGNAETVSNFAGNKKAEFAQISNRTKHTKLYRTIQIQRDDIVKLFPMLSGKEQEIDFMHGVAKSKQALRGAMNLFSNAYDNENITYDGLVAMAKHMEMRI